MLGLSTIQNSKFDFYISKGSIHINGFIIDMAYIYGILFNLLKVIGIIFLMYVIIKVGDILINNFVKRQEKLKISLNTKKAKTLGAVLRSLLKYTVYFFGVIGILELYFGQISLAFASIGGVAIGFGSQNLVRDILSGFFILFEEQYSVGDYVDIEGKSGIVDSIELRVTRLRDFNGDMHIIPNGLITKVTNHSKGDMRIMVDIDIAYEENVDKVLSIITKACEEFKKRDTNLVEGPKVLGISSFKENGLTIKVMGRVKNMKQWDSENLLRKELKDALDNAGINFAVPKVEIRDRRE